jgi:hypothetical protein
MTDFSQFRKLDVVGKTTEYTLFGLDEEPKPVLILRPAGTENKDYLNGLLRKFGGQHQVSRMRGATVENIEKQREAVRELFPECVVAGWRHVRDHDGNEVPFSVAACASLFAALPGYMIDDIRTFAEVPENFIARAPVDVDAVAGN